MKLRQLLASLPIPINVLADDFVRTDLDADVTGLSTNSQTCQPGDLFIGLPGTRVDGGEFWPSAIASGAVAALISPAAAQSAPPRDEACVLVYADILEACAQVSASFYGQPSAQLSLVGVTGTNGKTTTTHLIEEILGQSYATALLGTLYTRWPGHQQTALHTTPFSVDLQRQLAEAASAGATHAIMEVSSHALAQKRVASCQFDVAVFTNLTQDHLDYHRDMDEYFMAKAQLFTPAYLRGRAVINRDDPYGQRLVHQTAAPVWTYSTLTQDADFRADGLSYGPDGVSGQLHTPAGSTPFQSPLVGQFNLSNLLAAIAVALQLGLSLEAVVAALPQFTGVPGRMERVKVSPDQDVTVIVDYAHTPDSLENLLRASRPFAQKRLICVFGCGGDRDRTKRPQMGAIAAKLADWAIVTSDNPRTEDPAQILKDIVAGMDQATPTVIGDRAEAIRQAIAVAAAGDTVLIAGKGHEDYQILGTEKVHFDDREQARQSLQIRQGQR
ncbi:MAG: UDP-N-acetylmuramoyl-L-alanyl-D-glutamate--2,6-diaminopimelate ligase [Elainellaceae cyanobacterium]